MLIIGLKKLQLVKIENNEDKTVFSEQCYIYYTLTRDKNGT